MSKFSNNLPLFLYTYNKKCPFIMYAYLFSCLPLCLLAYTNITITIIIIIIISNTIPPIAPAITGTAPEPVVAVAGGGGVDGDRVDVDETSDECNEVVVGNTLVVVGGKAVYDEPSVLDTVTVLNNEILTISYLLVSDSVYDVLVTSAVEYVTDIQYNMNMKLFTDLIVTKCQ